MGLIGHEACEAVAAQEGSLSELVGDASSKDVPYGRCCCIFCSAFPRTSQQSGTRSAPRK